MSLKVKNIQFYNWRNFTQKTVSLDENVTILAGKNASGKTNTIEALQMLFTEKSFRNPKTQELVRDKSLPSSIQISLQGDERHIEMQLSIHDNHKAYIKNRKKSKPYLETIPVLFVPDDLLFIKEASVYRREEIDNFGALAHPGYKKLLQAYQKALKERNTYLKTSQIISTHLDVFNKEIAILGAELLIHRLSLFSQLSLFTQEIYQNMVSRETLTMVYTPTWTNQNIKKITKNEAYKDILTTLQKNYEKDMVLKQTTTGPHRDDFSFFINQQESRKYASQGQQRSIVLSWKLAQVQFIQKILNKTPLLLLDDVMSELDEKRRESVMKCIHNNIQTIITTTHLKYFSPHFLKQATVVMYD